MDAEASEREALLSQDSDVPPDYATTTATVNDVPTTPVNPHNGKRLFNVIALGLGFMCVFAAFQTSSMIEASVLSTIKNETAGTSDPYTGDGYTSLAIIYIVFSLANWLAPSIVSVLQPRISMVVSALVYNVFIFSFLYPMTWTLYLMSALLGLAAAVLWTAQGDFLTKNSNSVTMARNSGIFWCLLQCSLLIGNFFVYIEFNGITTIDKGTRTVVYWGLTGACIAGVLILCVLQRAPRASPEFEQSVNSETDVRVAQRTRDPGPIEAFLRAGRLLATRDMILLSITFFYTGVSLTFFSGVYGTAVGFTEKLGPNRKDLIPITGMLIGAGEASAGFVFGLFGKLANKYGRDNIITLGYILEMAAVYLIFLNLPDGAPGGDTSDIAYIQPVEAYVFVCAYLLGFSDACYNTQIMSILGVVYSDNSAPAFALFKFVQSFAAAIGFFYSQSLVLKWQLLILVVTGTMGTVSFNIVEWKAWSMAQGQDN